MAGITALQTQIDHLGEITRIVADAAEATGAPGVQPRQADEIQASALGYAAIMGRQPTPIKDGRLNPAEVTAVPRAPDHSSERL